MESGDPERGEATDDSLRSDLLDEILHDVASKHVTSAATYAALRSVCRRWRAAIPAAVPRPHRLPPQLPFLVLLFSRFRPFQPPHPAFFSLTTNRAFTLCHLDDVLESICLGACYGWLILLSPDLDVILRNPVTGDTIRPPSLDGTFFSTKNDPRARILLFDRQFFIRQAILSADPSADGGFLVALFASTMQSRCLIWRSGDDLWTVRDHPKFVPEDVIFYRDLCCIAIDSDGECVLFDFHFASETGSSSGGGGGSFFTSLPRLPVSGSPFLVESAGNVWLVMVSVAGPGEEPEFSTIYRLDLSELPAKVTAVPGGPDLGGRIWFLGQCNSMSVASAHFPGFEGDSLYLVGIKWCEARDPNNNYTANIWERQLRNGITRRHSSVEGERRVYTPWSKICWVPPNLHEKLGE